MINLGMSPTIQIYTKLDPALLKAFFYSPRLGYYSMHCWYFNLLDIKKHKAFTFWIFRTRPSYSFNDFKAVTLPGTYYQAVFNFSNKSIEIGSSSLVKTSNKLASKDFSYEVDSQEVIFTYNDKKYVFSEVTYDTHVNTISSLYKIVNINTRNKDVYLLAQNYYIASFLPPWIWVHLYLEDGTYIELFKAFGQKKNLMINDFSLPFTEVTLNGNRLSIKASDGKLYFNIELTLGEEMITFYRPPLFPTWKYKQYTVTVVKHTTNVLSVKNNQKGFGMVEVTKGILI